MDIERIIEEYHNQTKICALTDYSSKKSVKAHNSAVKRMYEIVELLKGDQLAINQISLLLDLKENNTDLWIATHLLERTIPGKQIESKALKIIEKAAKGSGIDALGYREWLKLYYTKK
jgi:hypothetical protein